MAEQFNNRTTAEEVCDAFPSQIKGKTILITGASINGMGAKYAQVLSKYSPAQILLVSRSQAKVDPVIEEVHATNPSVDVKFIQCELSDQDSVRRAATAILEDKTVTKIDIVINNAGVMAIQKYTVDKQGNEMQFSSNHLGHFLLTNLIMSKIFAAGEGSRIVNLTSHGHRISPFHFDDPKFDGGKTYDPWQGYGQSKTANILFSVELARRLEPHGIQAFAVHPGLITSTGLASHMEDFMAEVPALLAAVQKNNPGDVESWSTEVMGHQAKDDSQGCSSALVAALRPEWKGQSGRYVQDCQLSEAMGYALDGENAKKLWGYSEEVVGQKFDL